MQSTTRRLYAADMFMPAFQQWPTEAGIIARLLGGYGELELELALCLGHAISDKRKGIRDFFATRGETARIRLASVQAGPWMRATGIGDEFARTLVGVRACKDIRNSLSHCHWASLKHNQPSDGLFYVNLEKSAAASTGAAPIVYQWRHATLPWLQDCEAYYRYASDCLWHVQGRMAAQRGQPSSASFIMPPRRKPPAVFVPVSADSLARLPKEF
jgi:hypothetical protein